MESGLVFADLRTGSVARLLVFVISFDAEEKQKEKVADRTSRVYISFNEVFCNFSVFR